MQSLLYNPDLSTGNKGCLRTYILQTRTIASNEMLTQLYHLRIRKEKKFNTYAYYDHVRNSYSQSNLLTTNDYYRGRFGSSLIH